MTNRTPSPEEQQTGVSYFRILHKMFVNAEIVSIGTKAHNVLSQYDIEHTPVTHPANGRTNIYREQIDDLFKG